MERIWIYQANRTLNAEEAELLLEKMDKFTEQWTAHGKQLAAQALLRYNQFLIIRVNEGLAKATGCSIDKSTDTLKQVQQELGIDFFDRMQIAYRDAEGIKTVSRPAFEKLIESGAVDENTIVFNNMVGNTRELEINWEVPLKDSWHAQVFEV
ncbi:MAG TPA: hypothetical protein VKZ95_07210 [Sphingobacteriaceae bacterium]|nr:hypothetical protein [Sphingobacteriaceae bacterium]